MRKLFVIIGISTDIPFTVTSSSYSYRLSFSNSFQTTLLFTNPPSIHSRKSDNPLDIPSGKNFSNFTGNISYDEFYNNKLRNTSCSSPAISSRKSFSSSFSYTLCECFCSANPPTMPSVETSSSFLENLPSEPPWNPTESSINSFRGFHLPFLSGNPPAIPSNQDAEKKNFRMTSRKILRKKSR